MSTNPMFGSTPDGPVAQHVLATPELELSLLSLGATIQRVRLRGDDTRDVVLGFGTVGAYLEHADRYLGVTLGRYANRIAGARFALDGREHRLCANEGAHTLHGGTRGFNTRIWRVVGAGRSEVTYGLTSPDGEMGFPGSVDVLVRYRLVGNAIRIDYRATTDRPTVLGLSNHSYWNLDGGSGLVLEHELMIDAASFTPTDESAIPTGVLAPVAGSPFDFLELREISDAVASSDEQIRIAGGLDHNFAVARSASRLRPAARLWSPRSEILLDVSATHPGLQVYSGNRLETDDGFVRGGYRRHSGLALEPQPFPNAPNEPRFPSAVVEPGRPYRETILFRLTPGVQRARAAGPTT